MLVAGKEPLKWTPSYIEEMQEAHKLIRECVDNRAWEAVCQLIGQGSPVIVMEGLAELTIYCRPVGTPEKTEGVIIFVGDQGLQSLWDTLDPARYVRALAREHMASIAVAWVSPRSGEPKVMRRYDAAKVPPGPDGTWPAIVVSIPGEKPAPPSEGIARLVANVMWSIGKTAVWLRDTPAETLAAKGFAHPILEDDWLLLRFARQEGQGNATLHFHWMRPLPPKPVRRSARSKPATG